MSQTNTVKPSSQSDSRWSSGAGLPGIITIGDPILRQIAEEHKELAALRPLCDELVETLRSLNGAGLAASQIGRPEPVVVVEVRKTDLFPSRLESPLYVMINPKVVQESHERGSDWEGCFSIPGLMAKVERPERVLVEYQLLNGEERKEWFEGYVGRVVQHEIDHLKGILFTDIMDASTLTTVENWKRLYLPKILARQSGQES